MLSAVNGRRLNRKCLRRSHLDIRPEQDLGSPFHLALALPHAKSRRPHRHPQNGGGLAAAALLQAIGKAKLIDIEARVGGVDRDEDVDVLKTPRELSVQVDKPFPGLACQRGEQP